MSFKNSLRDRAIAAWRKNWDPKTGNGWKVRVWKNRKEKTITVEREVPWRSESRTTWSYKNGGKLEKVA